MNIAGKLIGARRPEIALTKKLYAFVFEGVEYLWGSVPNAKVMQGNREQWILLLLSEFRFFRCTVYFMTGLILLHFVDLIVIWWAPIRFPKMLVTLQSELFCTVPAQLSHSQWHPLKHFQIWQPYFWMSRLGPGIWWLSSISEELEVLLCLVSSAHDWFLKSTFGAGRFRHMRGSVFIIRQVFYHEIFKLFRGLLKYLEV